MLKRADIELLTQTGPGTPMGEVFRRFWLPVLLPSELPEPDCPPIRLTMLSEKLIAFRDSNGKPGFVAENCPHRGASLFFGRNEESGLRCVYHGWKFDTDGQCVDMPNEPAEVPRFEWGLNRVPPEQRQHSHKLIYECNWLQALEGELDTTHVYFLHSRLDPSLPAKYGAWVGDRAARL